MIIRNNTIVSNDGYGIKSSSPDNVNISNCILWNNSAGPLNNCNASDSWYGDPLFVDEEAGDYHLTWDSGCVDAGGNSSSIPIDENDIDGNPRVAGGIVDIGGDEDYPHCDKDDYDEWNNEDIGRPNCWFTWFQCKGDADCATEGALKWRVSANDLNLIIANWKKKIGDSGLNLCADIDHKPEGALKWRVSANDLNIVIANWKKKDGQLQPHCLECQSYKMNQGKTLTLEEMLEWLEKVWLDEEVQKLIDEDMLLKFIESLKEEL